MYVFAGLLAAITLAIIPAAAATPLLIALPDGGDAKTLRANPDRSYPPSCLSYPLPATVRGPAVNTSITLGGNNGAYFEQGQQVTVWRAACSGGQSAVLVRFERPSARRNTTPTPEVPNVFGSQPGRNNIPLRLHVEPNTVTSEVLGHSILSEAVLVLETIPGIAFDLDAAFTLRLETFYLNATQPFQINIPAYNAQTHPDANQALAIEGWLGGSWFDSARPGEGIFFEVAENPNGSRFVFFAWFTYGGDGRPYWLVGQGDAPATARTVEVATFYFSGGGFAGAFNPPVTQRPWGTVSFTFPSCSRMNLQFRSTHSEAGVPSGTGTRVWSRLTNLNGLACE
jgi:hypothetical protein